MKIRLFFKIYLFGGVQDVKDDDEELEGNFFNDLYTVSIENEKATWSEGEMWGLCKFSDPGDRENGGWCTKTSDNVNNICFVTFMDAL